MNLLLIGQGEPPACSLEKVLATAFQVEWMHEADEALSRAKHYEYNLIVLHVREPSQALVLLRKLHGQRTQAPALVICPSLRGETRVELLDAGADDCMGEWSYAPELLARARALVRRACGHAESAIRLGNLTIDLSDRSVAVKGAKLPLERKLYLTLELLALNEGKTVLSERFLRHVYQDCDEPIQNTLRQLICRLRRKLECAGADASIETVWAEGYRLNASAIPQLAIAA